MFHLAGWEREKNRELSHDDARDENGRIGEMHNARHCFAKKGALDRVCALSSPSLCVLSISDAGKLFGEGVTRDATVRVRWRSHCDAAFIRPVEAFAKR